MSNCKGNIECRIRVDIPYLEGRKEYSDRWNASVVNPGVYYDGREIPLKTEKRELSHAAD